MRGRRTHVDAVGRVLFDAVTVFDLQQDVQRTGALITVSSASIRYVAHPTNRYVPVVDAAPTTMGAITPHRPTPLAELLVEIALRVTRDHLSTVPNALPVE